MATLARIYEDGGEHVSHYEPTVPVAETEIDAAVQAVGRGDVKSMTEFILMLQRRMDIALELEKPRVIGTITTSQTQ